MELGRPLPRRHTVTRTGTSVGAGTIRADMHASAEELVVVEEHTHARRHTGPVLTPTTPHDTRPTHAASAWSNIICLCGSRQEQAGARAHAHPNALAQPHGLAERCMRAA